METVTFKDIAGLINLSPDTRIDIDVSLRSEPTWEVHSAQHTYHGKNIDYRVLYLKSDAKVNDLKAAHKEVAPYLRTTDVVYAPSLAPKNKALVELFAGKQAAAYYSTPEYIRAFLDRDLSRYAAGLANAYPSQSDYITPVLKSPSGIRSRWPLVLDPVLDLLRTAPGGVGEEDTPRLGVVLAEAGQGKTYYSQYLASQLVKDWRTQGRRLPIYIDSKQWTQLSTDDMASIAKTILHSFRHFGAPIGWAEGHEEQFLRTTLGLGLFTLIFDGLDEYVLWSGRMAATDALRVLTDMASSTTAGMVVTSRTSFWNAEILSVQPDVAETMVFEHTLMPFDPNHARNYFKKRGLAEQGVDRAVHVFRALSRIDEAMAGRGFVLALVADLFKEGDVPPQEVVTREGEGIVEWLMPALCDRERTRQKLELNAADQLAILRDLATVDAKKQVIDDSLFTLAVQGSTPLDEREAVAVREKMTAHPLIERSQGLWRFKQDYVRNLLVAQYVDRLLDGAPKDQLGRFLASIGAKDPKAVELAEVLVKVLLTRDASGDRVRRLITAFTSEQSGVVDPVYAKFVSALALGTVSALQPQGERLERMTLLSSLFHSSPPTGGGTLRVPGLALSGTVTKFDFRGVLLERCLFEEVTFAKCDFDGRTVFRDCRFVGGADAECRDFGKVRFEPSPRGDGEALRWIHNRQVAAAEREYTSEDLGEDLAGVLRKFLGRGGVGLKSVEERLLKRASIQHSPHGGEILDVVRRRILEEHTISGVGTGLHVRREAEEAMRFFAMNNRFVGPVQDTFRELQKKLGLTPA